MGKPKRQIIKTRPQQPYIIARIFLALLVIAAIVVASVLLLTRPHPAHAMERSSLLDSRQCSNGPLGPFMQRSSLLDSFAGSTSRRTKKVEPSIIGAHRS